MSRQLRVCAPFSISHKKPKVVILGGGFAGIECAKIFKHQNVEVLIIDRQNYHLFQPLLYQVASAGLAAPEIAHPIRSIFYNQDNVTVMMEEVTGIDFDAKQVKPDGSVIDYDYLVIGLGVKTGYFGNDEWKEHARGRKSLDGAMAIRRDLVLAFEKAEACRDPVERERLMTIGVIGTARGWSAFAVCGKVKFPSFEFFRVYHGQLQPSG